MKYLTTYLKTLTPISHNGPSISQFETIEQAREEAIKLIRQFPGLEIGIYELKEKNKLADIEFETVTFTEVKS